MFKQNFQKNYNNIIIVEQENLEACNSSQK